MDRIDNGAGRLNFLRQDYSLQIVRAFDDITNFFEQHQ